MHKCTPGPGSSVNCESGSPNEIRVKLVFGWSDELPASSDGLKSSVATIVAIEDVALAVDDPLNRTELESLANATARLRSQEPGATS
jgi:hypothetical protein